MILSLCYVLRKARISRKINLSSIFNTQWLTYEGLRGSPSLPPIRTFENSVKIVFAPLCIFVKTLVGPLEPCNDRILVINNKFILIILITFVPQCKL